MDTSPTTSLYMGKYGLKSYQKKIDLTHDVL